LICGLFANSFNFISPSFDSFDDLFNSFDLFAVSFDSVADLFDLIV
jgi:hypothetical protein